MAEIDNYLRSMLELNASDLHLRAGMRPRWRIGSQLQETGEFAAVTADQVEQMCGEILTGDQMSWFVQSGELDLGYSCQGTGRFRCNFFRDHRGAAAVVRRIPDRIPTLRELNLPQAVESFAHLRRGLVLVTGASGSGKTTTLAALLDVINSHYRKHIITLEDPIEYLHERKRAVIHQRGMHYDIEAFHTGITGALRQDPDVLMIGELRDFESIRQAVSAAESGLLVFATLHTNGAIDSIDRLVSVFPSEQQPLVRTQLADSLAGIVSQVLMDRIDDEGRIPATEVLVATSAARGMIREGNTQDLVNIVQSGRDHGMHSLDDSLESLVRRRSIDPVQAAAMSRNRRRFERYLQSVAGGALVGSGPLRG